MEDTKDVPVVVVDEMSMATVTMCIDCRISLS